jgi:hypothetical protein
MKNAAFMLLAALATSVAASAAQPDPAALDPAVDTSANARPAAAPPAAAKPAATPPHTAPATPAKPAAAAATTTRAAAAPTGSGKARDRIDLETTQITGNRELPRVMYVVPWKKSDLGDLGGRPANSLLDEVLAPVDRDVFQRQNRYYDALKPDAKAPGSAASPAE